MVFSSKNIVNKPSKVVLSNSIKKILQVVSISWVLLLKTANPVLLLQKAIPVMLTHQIQYNKIHFNWYTERSPEAEYKRWLRECYEAAHTRALECIMRGRINSRLQALVTACKLMQAEGKYPLEQSTGYNFPSVRLKVKDFKMS